MRTPGLEQLKRAAVFFKAADAHARLESRLRAPGRHRRGAAKETNEKWMKSPAKFERLVLGCMDSYDSNQIVILQDFSRSTRFAILCTAQISKFHQKFVKLFSNFCLNFCKIAITLFHRILHRFWRKFIGISLNTLENVENFSNFRNFWKKLMYFPEFWQNFDRILMWKVRMVRSVADRTFQPSRWRPRRGRSSPG